ncbi:MAG TPA: ATP-binding protein [Candidatus Dormibacteraeota bacterium]|nr:ATP-binding protein [Candidatus Dormibacteraeota bacterium]
MMDSSTVDAWLATPTEDEHLDFKEARSQFDKTKLARYCVALANEQGGFLILGVTDRRPRRVAGTGAFPAPGQTKAWILEKLHLRIEITEVAHPNGRVLVIEVPSRPQGHPYAFEGTYLMRSGEQLIAMTPEQLRRIFSETEAAFLLQSAASGLDDDGLFAALDIPGYFELVKLPFPSSRHAAVERLISERFAQKHGSLYAITNLGALTLARDVRHFPSIEHRAVRVVTFRTTDKLHAEHDDFLPRGYAIGFVDLLRHIEDLLPANEVLAGALRKDFLLVPPDAIRELAANALIHQDFGESGSPVTVEIYSDRIEFGNPGTPLIKTARFVDEYKSRNELLADVMRRLGICEVRGSGIDRVVASTEFYQLPAPDFRTSPTRTTTILFAPRAFADMSLLDRVNACYLHCCLRWVSNRQTTNQSLRERFGLTPTRTHTSQMSTIIAEAICSNLIRVAEESKGKRYAKYVPTWA